MSDYKVSSQIDNKLPGFVRDDYSKFVDFIQDCYKSEERRGSSLDLLRNILSYKDFTIFDSLESNNTQLQSSIDDTDTEIILLDGTGFPEKNGVIRIDDEIILYKTRTNNTLNDCLRGSSYVTKLSDIYSLPEYTYSIQTNHSSGSTVEDLTSLTVYEFLKQTYNNFLPTLTDEWIHNSIRRSTILNGISSFYRSKGSEDGIQILFKMIYGSVNVDVFYPGEQILRCSDSTWTERDVLKCELISGDINIVSNNTLYQLTDNFDTNLESASLLIEDVKKVSYEGRYIYELNINPNYKIGNVRVCPKTVLTRTLSPSDTVVTVESTYGFPSRNGKFYIDSEEITYSYKTSNQFHGCVRNSPISHSVGVNVFGVGFLYAYLNNETTILRVLGVVSHVHIKESGLFNEPSELKIGEMGSTRIDEPIIEKWVENTNYNLATVADTTIFDVSDYTYGVNSVYFDNDNVFVQSSSLPSTTIGPFGTSDALNLRPVVSYCKFPRKTKNTNVNVSVGSESIGMFINGVLAQSHCVDEKVISGQVTSISVISPGSGYNNPPKVIIEGGSGSGVIANAILINGKVTSVNITNGGSGFTSIPTVRFSSGEDAEIDPTIDSYGRITTVSVTNGGNYYTDPPQLVLVDPTGRGRGAILIVNPNGIVNGVIQPNSIRIVNSGIDYSQQSYIVVNPIGSGATGSVEVYSYIKDSYNYVQNNFDSNGGYVYPRRVGSSLVRNTYCYNADPIGLRLELSDNGNNHSPILGYAFDGNPIYGPYGYSDPMDNTSNLIRMKSSYQIGSRGGTNPPSTLTYPLGTFIQDYVYIQNLGTLDEHNGRFCITPEYPNGTYAYFITVSDFGTPTYPYIIGPTYKSLPVSQNIDFLNESVSPDLTKISIVNQNFYDEISISDYDYSSVVRRRNSNLTELNRNIQTSILSTSVGSIQNVYIDYSDTNYAVGDLCKFDYSDNQGGGCEAKVSWVVGSDVVNLTMAVPNVRVFTHEQQIDFSSIEPKTFSFEDISISEDLIQFDQPHEFLDGMRVLYTNTDGNIPDGLVDNKTYFVKVIDSTNIKLSVSLTDLKYENYVNIKSQGTGNKLLSPVYSFTKDQIITSENGSEFLVKEWNTTSKILNINIQNQTRVISGDVFRDNIGATVYVPVNSITLPSIQTEVTEIPVNSTISFRSGDIIQIGTETMTVSDIMPNKVLKVIRDDTTHPVIKNDTYVVNLSRLAIIVSTNVEHDLSIGDTVEILDATPQFMSGIVTVGDILDSTTFVCFKKLSELDSNNVFEGASNPDGLVLTTTIQPYYITNLTSGRLWWSPLTGTLYIYYIDEDSGQWVGAQPTGVVPNQLGEFTNAEMISGDPSPTGNLITGSVIQICQIAPGTRKNGTKLKQGDLWWSSLTGYLYIYFEGKWVPATPNGVVPRQDESAVGNAKSRDTIILNSSGEELIINTSSNEPIVNNEFFGPETPGSYLIIGENSEYLVIDPDGNEIVLEAPIIELIERESVVTVSLNPPIDGTEPVQDGDLWWSTFSGFLYIRYNSKWVVATPIGVTPSEGASNTPVSKANFEDIDYLVILVAGGDYYYVTTSLSVIGPIHKFNISSSGTNLNVLPDILGVYPRELDRCRLNVIVNLNGTIDDIVVLSGGNRYKNPKVLFISQNGSGAEATVTVSNGTITDINISNSGENYTSDDLEVLVIETGNILVPISDNIGKIESIKMDRVGSYQNYDPTIIPSVETDIRCTVIDVQNNFIVGSEVTSDSGKFEGIVSSWDSNKRILTITNYQGVLSAGDVITTQHASGKILQSGQSQLLIGVDSIANLDGEYVTSKSILSSSYQKLIDSYYYQDFSYVIRSTVGIDDYRNVVKSNIHPAGFMLFGELQLIDQVTTVQSIVTSEVIIN